MYERTKNNGEGKKKPELLSQLIGDYVTDEGLPEEPA